MTRGPRGAARPGSTARVQVPTGAGLRCPFCHDAVEGSGVACTACLAPHHTECWDETEVCSNCGGGERYAQVERTRDEGTARRTRPSLKG